MSRTAIIVLTVAAGLGLLGPAPAHAARTDVVVLVNGDRITGEAIQLNRGQLEFKTDDAGTLQIEWDKVRRLEATREFEVGTGDGRRFLGRLGASAEGTLTVVGPASNVTLTMAEVTFLTPIGASLWRQLDGSIDAGFSYTRSSDVAQLNVNSTTVLRKPSFEGRLGVSLTATRREGGERDDRGSVDASYVYSRWTRWFVAAGARFESNQSLGLDLRSQAAIAIGPRLVRSNRSQVQVGAGVVVNHERGVDVAPTSNVEGLLLVKASFFTYDRPRTQLDLALQYYPSISEGGRRRLQLDASAKREVWKDFFLALNVFDSYDSRPPNPEFDTNDVGVVVSVGWSY